MSAFEVQGTKPAAKGGGDEAGLVQTGPGSGREVGGVRRDRVVVMAVWGV